MNIDDTKKKLNELLETANQLSMAVCDAGVRGASDEELNALIKQEEEARSAYLQFSKDALAEAIKYAQTKQSTTGE